MKRNLMIAGLCGVAAVIAVVLLSHQGGAGNSGNASRSIVTTQDGKTTLQPPPRVSDSVTFTVTKEKDSTNAAPK